MDTTTTTTTPDGLVLTDISNYTPAATEQPEEEPITFVLVG